MGGMRPWNVNQLAARRSKSGYVYKMLGAAWRGTCFSATLLLAVTIKILQG